MPLEKIYVVRHGVSFALHASHQALLNMGYLQGCLLAIIEHFKPGYNRSGANTFHSSAPTGS